MSAKTTRPRVQSVTGSAASAAAVGGAMLVGVLIAGVARSLGAAAREAFKSASTALPQPRKSVIVPVNALREEQSVYKTQTSALVAHEGLTPVEQAQISVLASIAASPYMALEDSVLRQSLGVLQNARTLVEVKHAEQALHKALDEGHQHIFVHALTTACASAAIKIGFSAIEASAGPLGKIIVTAMDTTGRALVTEIHADEHAEPTVETEVVGVADGSCNRILDAFDKALEEVGVRSAPPSRKYTGGVCDLAATRKFVASRLRPRQTSSVIQPAAGQSAGRRSQRLNTSRTQKQR